MDKTSKRITRRPWLCLLALCLLAGLCACGSTPTTTSASTPTTAPPSAPTAAPTNTPTSAPTTAPTTPPSTSNNVSIANFAFSPASLTVKIGTKVTWTNNDTVTHTVTANQGAFNSGPLAPGHSFSFTFTKAGTYSYHCNIHPSMMASIVVQ